MKVALFCAVFAAAAPAFADTLVARQGDDMISLAEAPCESKSVQMLLQAQSPLYKAASAKVEGQSFSGCWRQVGEVIHVVYEDGDQGVIPVSDLKAEISV